MKKYFLLSLLLTLPILAGCTSVGRQTASPAPITSAAALATPDMSADLNLPDNIPPPPPPPPLTPETISGFDQLPPDVQEKLREALENPPESSDDAANSNAPQATQVPSDASGTAQDASPQSSLEPESIDND